jgi:hypothetical protein
VSIEAFERLELTVEDAGLVDVSVGGRPETAGTPGLPHTYRFTIGDAGGDRSSSE